MFIPANRRNENIFINLDVSTQHGILLCMVFAYSIKHILNTTIDTIQFQKDFLLKIGRFFILSRTGIKNIPIQQNILIFVI